MACWGVHGYFTFYGMPECLGVERGDIVRFGLWLDFTYLFGF